MQSYRAEIAHARRQISEMMRDLWMRLRAAYLEWKIRLMLREFEKAMKEVKRYRIRMTLRKFDEEK